MSAIACPVCAKLIPMDDVNVAEGVALCRACGQLSRLGEIAGEGAPNAGEVLQAPPPAGCRMDDDGVTLRVVASARSLAGALGLLVFTIFWNGIVGLFVVIMASSLWVRLVGPIPAWLPSMPGGSAPTIPLGIAVFMVIFLMPFVGVGVLVFGTLLVALFGNVTVSVRGGEGSIFTGVGAIGRRKKFDALVVRSVRVIDVRSDDSHTRCIELEADKTLKFGSGLTETRRCWMAGMIQAILVTRPSRPGGSGGRATLRASDIPPVSGPPLPEEPS